MIEVVDDIIENVDDVNAKPKSRTAPLVGMMRQRRSPSVENGYDADARAQMFLVGRDRRQDLGRRLEQDVVDRRLALIDDIGMFPSLSRRVEIRECQDEAGSALTS
jgi:hypothetical protein